MRACVGKTYSLLAPKAPWILAIGAMLVTIGWICGHISAQREDRPEIDAAYELGAQGQARDQVAEGSTK